MSFFDSFQKCSRTNSTWKNFKIKFTIYSEPIAMAEKKDKKEINIVDQNAIWRETIRKENRCQKLYTQYHINPYKQSNQVSGNFLQNPKIFQLFF